jgi:hypothetical protein
MRFRTRHNKFNVNFFSSDETGYKCSSASRSGRFIRGKRKVHNSHWMSGRVDCKVDLDTLVMKREPEQSRFIGSHSIVTGTVHCNTPLHSSVKETFAFPIFASRNLDIAVSANVSTSNVSFSKHIKKYIKALISLGRHAEYGSSSEASSVSLYVV